MKSRSGDIGFFGARIKILNQCPLFDLRTAASIDVDEGTMCYRLIGSLKKLVTW